MKFKAIQKNAEDGQRSVRRGIDNRQKHHAKKTFREEYVELLEGFSVDFDPRFIFSDQDAVLAITARNMPPTRLEVLSYFVSFVPSV